MPFILNILIKFICFLGGRFCSFSPCIEQTQRVCETLEKLGFVDIQSMEILQVEDIVKTKSIPVLDLEFVKHKVRIMIIFRLHFKIIFSNKSITLPSHLKSFTYIMQIKHVLHQSVHS